MPLRRYLIVNAFGRSNRGDSVLLDQCIEQIRLADPDAEITGLVFEGLADAKVAHPDVVWAERFGNSVHFSGILGRLESLVYIALAWLSAWSGWLWPVRLLPQEQQRAFAALKQADMVISAPGGYIHDTNLAYIIALAHILYGTLLGIPTVLAPQSVGPLTSSLSVRLSRFVLSRCQTVCVRENYSRDFLIDKVGLPSKIVRVTGDSAFWDADVTADLGMISAEMQQIGLLPGEAYIGCTVVDWSFPNLPDAQRLRRQYFEGMGAVISRIHAKYGLRTVIFNQVASDLESVRHVAAIAGSAALVDAKDREPSLLRGLIGHSRVFLGTRFHSCIFAMMSGLPVTAISYLPKTEFIMRMLGLEDNVVRIDEFDVEAVVTMVSRHLNDTQTAATRVANAVNTYQQTQTQFRQILEDLGFNEARARAC